MKLTEIFKTYDGDWDKLSEYLFYISALMFIISFPFELLDRVDAWVFAIVIQNHAIMAGVFILFFRDNYVKNVRQ